MGLTSELTATVGLDIRLNLVSDHVNGASLPLCNEFYRCPPDLQICRHSLLVCVRTRIRRSFNQARCLTVHCAGTLSRWTWIFQRRHRVSD